MNLNVVVRNENAVTYRCIIGDDVLKRTKSFLDEHSQTHIENGVVEHVMRMGSASAE
jgi:hypothetical protein